MGEPERSASYRWNGSPGKFHLFGCEIALKSSRRVDRLKRCDLGIVPSLLKTPRGQFGTVHVVSLNTLHAVLLLPAASEGDFAL